MAEGYLWWRPCGSPGFDGWVQLVREEFDTDDMAAAAELTRLRAIGLDKRAMLEARGVDVESLRLSCECNVVYNPPEYGDERIWAIDHFKDKMLECVLDDEELATRLLQHQLAVHGVEPLHRAADTGRAYQPEPAEEEPSCEASDDSDEGWRREGWAAPAAAPAARPPHVPATPTPADAPVAAPSPPGPSAEAKAAPRPSRPRSPSQAAVRAASLLQRAWGRARRQLRPRGGSSSEPAAPPPPAPEAAGPGPAELKVATPDLEEISARVARLEASGRWRDAAEEWSAALLHCKRAHDAALQHDSATRLQRAARRRACRRAVAARWAAHWAGSQASGERAREAAAVRLQAAARGRASRLRTLRLLTPRVSLGACWATSTEWEGGAEPGLATVVIRLRVDPPPVEEQHKPEDEGAPELPAHAALGATGLGAATEAAGDAVGGVYEISTPPTPAGAVGDSAWCPSLIIITELLIIIRCGRRLGVVPRRVERRLGQPAARGQPGRRECGGRRRGSDGGGGCSGGGGGGGDGGRRGGASRG